MGEARNLRTMRIAAGQTVQDLAAATNISADQIKEIERGRRRADDDILAALAAHYGVSLEILKSR